MLICNRAKNTKFLPQTTTIMYLKLVQNTPLENAAHNTLHESKEKHTTETDERRKKESCTAEYERGRFILFSGLEKGNLRHQMSSKLLWSDNDKQGHAKMLCQTILQVTGYAEYKYYVN